MSFVWQQILLLIAMLSGCRAFGGTVTNRLFVAHRAAAKQQRCLALWSNNPDKSEAKWEYKPFVPPPPPRVRPQRRRFSTNDNWTVPKSIKIPEDRLDISFSRSSGAGGQNVNKVESKVDIRFEVMKADWIPREVRERIREKSANRINKEGYLNLASQEHRTQIQNRKTALAKLQEIILQAYPRPVERKVRTGVSKAAKARNKEDKKKRSDTKGNRKQVDF